MASVSLEKYIFNYRYIERLETDSVVGRLVEKKRLNNLVYVEQHQCSRREFSQENGEQERNDMGKSVFPETDPISLFWGLLIYLLLHIGMNTESRQGVSSPDLYQNQVLHINV